MDALKYVSQILDDADSWETMMFLYDAALRQMSTKIDILNEEFIHIHNYNPIEHVKSRIKEPKSIVKKLKRQGHEVTLENMLKYIKDIAGIRIICSFTQDIYRIADMLAKQSDLRVVELTDYLTHPKVSGYRSYHMIIEIPVFFSDSKKPIRVEVQIRTIAMDFWASLDHQLKYKKSFVDLNGEISSELKQCADVIAQTDNKMLEIRKRIEAQGVTVSRD